MKRNYPNEGVAILEKYLERGQLALEALQTAKLDRAERFLRRQSAAFHNFMAIDQLAQVNGVDMANSPEIKALAKKVLVLDQNLASALQESISQQRDELVQVMGFRKHLRKYRAVRQPDGGFKQSV